MNKLLITIAISLVSLCSLTVTTVSADNQGYTEGCPASYWRSTQDWQEYTPWDQVDSLFDLPDRLEAYKATPLIFALNYSDDNPDERLLREGVAGFLNAAHEGIAYPYRRSLAPLASIEGALQRGNTAEIIGLAVRIEDANNADCPFAPRLLPDGGDTVIARMGKGAAVGVIAAIGFVLIAVGFILRSKE